jgi:hypothetical protein
LSRTQERPVAFTTPISLVDRAHEEPYFVLLEETPVSDENTVSLLQDHAVAAV